MKVLGKVTLLATALFAMTGCFEKEASYQSLDRNPDEISKTKIDTSKIYLYVPSTGTTPRYAQTQNPFFTGSPVMVKFRFEEEALIAYQIDEDDRLDASGKIIPGRYVNSEDQDIELRPVMSIPGTYHDYRCDVDQFGECTNFEEEIPDADFSDSHNAWKEKRYFRPDWAEMDPIAINSAQAWFNTQGVSKKQRVLNEDFNGKGYQIEDGVLNISMKRTYTVVDDDSVLNAYYRGQLGDLSFTTEFFYSFVDIEQLRSKDYLPIHYKAPEHSRMGFFKDGLEYAGQTGESTYDDEETYYLRRFNPEKAHLTYYLSDNFYKPENKMLLDATYDTIAVINSQVDVAGVPQIKLAKAEGKHSGDLRYNLINLVDDPLKNGLLGYGPSITHPLTGEILKAHVNQYAGVARTTSRRTWNDAVRFYNRGDFSQPIEVDPTPVPVQTIAQAASTNVEASYEARLAGDSLAIAIDKQKLFSPTEKDDRFSEGYTKFLSQESPLNELEKFAVIERQQQIEWSKHTALSVNTAWVSSTSKTFIKGLNPEDYVGDDDKLPRWDGLNDQQKKEISDAITLQVYNSTLVHEMGHNLGLRHNFMGSVDKDNYYSEQDVKELNKIPAIAKGGLDTRPAYSSVMDYGRNIFDELPIYGKYDLAALRFGYNREMDVPYTEGEGDDAVNKIEVVKLGPIDRIIQDGYDSTHPLRVPKPLQYGIVQYLENISETTTKLREALSLVAYREADIARLQQNWDNANSITRPSIQLEIDQTIDLKEQAEAQRDLWQGRLNDAGEITSTFEARLNAATEANNIASDKVILLADKVEKEVEAAKKAELTAQLESAKADVSSSAAEKEKWVQKLVAARVTMSAIEDQMVKGEFKRYFYCTDENSGTSTLCNPFDEGSNIHEITRFRIQQYLDSYPEVNFRGERDTYNALSTQYNYIINRLYEFASIRDVIEDYEDLSGAAGLSIERLENYAATCTAGEGPCNLVRDYSNASKEAANFFIEVLKEQDHICEVVDLVTLEANENDPLQVENRFKRLIPLQAIYSIADRDGYLAPATDVPTSCFDPVVKNYMEEIGYPIGDFQVATRFKILSETGRYLNSFRDNNPEFVYTSDRAVLGTWSDKLLAMQFLVRRYSLGSNSHATQGALVDLNQTSSDLIRMLQDWVLVTDVSGFTTKDTTTDANGDPATPYAPIVFGREDQVESIAFSSLRSFFGLNPTGRTELMKAYLAQVALHGDSDDDTYGLLAKRWINMVSVYDEDSQIDHLSPKQLVAPEWVSVTVGETQTEQQIDQYFYQALPSNLLASSLIDQVRSVEYSTNEMSNALALRTYNVPPARDPDGALFATGSGGVAEATFAYLRSGMSLEAVFGEADDSVKSVVLAAADWQSLIDSDELKDALRGTVNVDDPASYSLPVRLLSGRYTEGEGVNEVEKFPALSELASAWTSVEKQWIKQQDPEYHHPRATTYNPLTDREKKLYELSISQLADWANVEKRPEILELTRRLKLLTKVK